MLINIISRVFTTHSVSLTSTMKTKATASASASVAGQGKDEGKGKGKGKGKHDQDDMEMSEIQAQAEVIQDESTASKCMSHSKRRGPLGKKLNGSSSQLEVGLETASVSD